MIVSLLQVLFSHFQVDLFVGDPRYNSVIAMSTTIVEYMATGEAAKEALWLKRLVEELGLNQGGIQLHCDSQSAIYLAKNQVYRVRTKHIAVRFHKIRELIVTKKKRVS